MTELLLKEKFLPLSHLPASVREKLAGVLRIVDERGDTFGLFLDRAAVEDLREGFEYSSPAFWEEIEASRASGTVAASDIESRLGLT